jgi:hypothetical protein
MRVAPPLKVKGKPKSRKASDSLREVIPRLRVIDGARILAPVADAQRDREAAHGSVYPVNDGALEHFHFYAAQASAAKCAFLEEKPRAERLLCMHQK